MIETLSPKKELEDLKADLHEVQELLRRHKLVERQEMQERDSAESATHGQNFAELRAKLDSMHPADIAYVLESLPLEERLVVWNLVKAERDGEILLQASDAVRETLIRSMDLQELVAAAEQLEADEIADLAPDLPEGVIHDVFQALPVEEREQLRAAMSYAEDAVGALMDFDVVSVREDTAIETVTRYLRRFDALPHHTDQIFVVDRDERLKGVLPLSKLIVSELEHNVGKVMVSDVVTLQSGDKAQDAAQAFERYDLVSAPVVDEQGKLIGRVTVDKVVDFIRSKSESEHRKKWLAKELGVSLLNGLIWGSALGLIAYWLYQKVSLGLVMTAAMTLNLALSATAGVLIPLTMMRLGRDPALGSSVMITAITDSGGVFFFFSVWR